MAIICLLVTSSCPRCISFTEAKIMPFSVTTKFAPTFFIFNAIAEKFKSLSKVKYLVSHYICDKYTYLKKDLCFYYVFCLLKTASGLMCASPFQKRHKQRKAHGDHNVTSDTAIVVGTSFMCLC